MRLNALFTRLQHHKTIIFMVFLLLFIFAGAKFYSLNLDTSISSLFPDSSSAMAQTGKLLQFNPGTRVLLVELSADQPVKSELLKEIAQHLRTALDGLLHKDSFQDLPEPKKILQIVPGLFDERMQRELQDKLEPNAMQKRLADMHSGMSGPLAFLPKTYLRDDPLGLIALVMQRFTASAPDSEDGQSGFGISTDILNGRNFPISPDGRRLLLILQPEIGIHDVYGAKRFMDKLQDSLSILAPADSGINAVISGGLRFTAENTVTIERDLKLTVSLSVLLIALIYLFTVRSMGAIWLLLTPLAAVIFSSSVMSVVWPATAGLAMGFGAAVLGLAEDYAVLVHFALRRNQKRKSEALSILARPMLFSAALCISSFCILMLSGIPALRQLGFFAAFSLLSGLVIALVILPLCPWIDHPKIKSTANHATDEICLHPRLYPALALAVVCIVVCVAGFIRIPFDASFQSMGANSTKLQQELLDLRSRWQSGTEPQVWASSGKNTDDALENAAELARQLRNHAPESASKIFALSDILPPASTRAENIQRWNHFVQKNSQSLEFNLNEAGMANNFKAGAFAGFTTWFAQEVPNTQNGQELLEHAGLGDILWWMLIEEHEDASHVLAFSPASGFDASFKVPEGSVLLSSAAVAQGLNQAFEQEKRLLPLAGAVCLFLLILCFRKPERILLSCLPPLFGLAAIVSWLLISGSPLTLAGAAALILVIGLGADYGIVMLHELSSKFSISAFKSILVSGLTTLAGLGILMLAKHPVLHTLGNITFFGLVAEMVAVLLIVPFLCKKN